MDATTRAKIEGYKTAITVAKVESEYNLEQAAKSLLKVQTHLLSLQKRVSGLSGLLEAELAKAEKDLRRASQKRKGRRTDVRHKLFLGRVPKPSRSNRKRTKVGARKRVQRKQTFPITCCRGPSVIEQCDRLGILM